MDQPGLVERHRDKNGEISRKHGNTEVRTLRNMYGKHFAAGVPETTKLSALFDKLDAGSLSQILRNHEDGTFERRIRAAGG